MTEPAKAGLMRSDQVEALERTALIGSVKRRSASKLWVCSCGIETRGCGYKLGRRWRCGACLLHWAGECAWCGADLVREPKRCMNRRGEAFCTRWHRSSSGRALRRFKGKS